MVISRPDRINIVSIENKLKNGEIKVPQFQRDFVWNKDDSARLMDSIVKGFPIGSFTFWTTRDRLRAVKNIGGYPFKESSPNDTVSYVLDGQQRITSIFACITGTTIGKADYSKMYINLTATDDESIVVLDISGMEEFEYISIRDLWSQSFSSLIARYNVRPGIIEKIGEYKDRLRGYDFSVIDMQDSTLFTATEIFTRINTSGKKLTVFEIMCAKTFDEDRNFDLSEKRKNQLEKWAGLNYETIPDITVLQAISICLLGECRQQDILRIDKDAFIDIWDDIDRSFDEAIDYMKNCYQIPVSKLMPYDALLVPYVYYFYKNKNQKPKGKNITRLKDYFWRCVLSQKFVQGTEAGIASDCVNVVGPILKNREPNEKSLVPVDIGYDSIKEKGVFSTSSAYTKGILCILAAQNPRSFDDGVLVAIDNNWLSQSNSKNYHHFFPKAYMRRHQSLIDDDLVNHIANITIVDNRLNKTIIKDRKPSDYMADFKKHNPDIKATMATHLIDIDTSGIWDDNYELFFEQRIKKIQEQLRDRLILKAYDKV